MDLWKPELFESDLPKSQTVFWMPSDTEELFDRQKPLGWAKTSIEYRMNRHGFRGIEFDEPAEFKILVSGCSHTMGIGIREEDTWCNQFATRIAGAKVYNLALYSRSPDYVVRSIYKAINIVKPNLVMVLWPDRGRGELADASINGIKFWLASDQDYPTWFLDREVQRYQFQKNQIMLESICSANGIPFLGFERMYLAKNVCNFDYLARDLMHDGPNWHGEIANHYWKKYQEML